MKIGISPFSPNREKSSPPMIVGRVCNLSGPSTFLNRSIVFRVNSGWFSNFGVNSSTTCLTSGSGAAALAAAAFALRAIASRINFRALSVVERTVI